MRCTCVLILLLLMCTGVYAQDLEEMGHIMRFVGAGAPEEVDVHEAERLSDLLRHPLRLNLASWAELSSSGLFSHYQIASLTDYQTSHGDVMSLVELAAVDGFGSAFVQVVSPFISLEGGKVGVAGNRKTGGEVTARGAIRHSDGQEWNYGLKYRMDVLGRMHLSLGVNRPYGASRTLPEGYSLSLEYLSRRSGSRVLAGDFNARFGQGLTLWNGAFMTGLHSPESFMRKPSAVSRCWSYDGSSAYSGIAGEVPMGSLTLSALVAFPGIKDVVRKPELVTMLPVVNLTWRCRYGHVAVTDLIGCRVFGREGMTSAASSVDASFCIRGVNVYGEAAYEWVEDQLRFLAGTDFEIGESTRMAALVRGLSGESYRVAFGTSVGEDYSRHNGVFSVDALCYCDPKGDDEYTSMQVKARMDLSFRLAHFFLLKVHADGRYRTWGQPLRLQVRSDMCLEMDPFCVNVRADFLRCRNFAASGYAEGGYRTNDMSVYLRAGAFMADSWDDRIYVYERDIPGSFNVPALYGRGFWTSACMSYRPHASLKVGLRASYTGYPFMEESKPGKAELKLYAAFRF